MSWQGQIVIVVFSIIMLMVVLELLRRKKINEAITLWWLFIFAFVVIITLNHRLLFKITHFMGAVLPASALTLLSLAFITFMLIYFSMKISVLSNQTKELAQYIALLENKVNEQDTKK